LYEKNVSGNKMLKNMEETTQNYALAAFILAWAKNEETTFTVSL